MSLIYYHFMLQTFLTLYCFAGGHHLTSLQLLYRARYLTLLVGGDDHPQVALLDVSEIPPDLFIY